MYNISLIHTHVRMHTNAYVLHFDKDTKEKKKDNIVITKKYYVIKKVSINFAITVLDGNY